MHGVKLEDYFPLPAFSEMVVACARELTDEGKSMSSVRLAVAIIVDAHRREGLEFPLNAGVSLHAQMITRRFARVRRDRY